MQCPALTDERAFPCRASTIRTSQKGTDVFCFDHVWPISLEYVSFIYLFISLFALCVRASSYILGKGGQRGNESRIKDSTDKQEGGRRRREKKKKEGKLHTHLCIKLFTSRGAV